MILLTDAEARSDSGPQPEHGSCMGRLGTYVNLSFVDMQLLVMRAADQRIADAVLP